MCIRRNPADTTAVSLFTREWIEIPEAMEYIFNIERSPSLRGSGLKSCLQAVYRRMRQVSLFTREWIEIIQYEGDLEIEDRLPLYEGVD